MQKTLRQGALIAAWLALGSAPVLAQGAASLAGADSTLVDRVIAMVGDSVILLSEVQEELALARAQNVPATEAEVLENLVNVQLVLQAASRDSTVIPNDAEVLSRAEEQMELVRERFPDEAAYQRALSAQGLSPQAYRDQLRARIRAELIRQAYLQKTLQSAAAVAVTEAEMRAVFDERREQLQQRPELLTIQQVALRAGASDSAWEAARLKADSLYAQATQGADFAALATEHSQDPGTAEQGGELGWVTRGQTVPEFEQTVFTLRDGGVSIPVRTEFGYHVIKVERSRPGEKRVRHILIRPEMAPADLERSRALAEDLARRIRAGESATALAAEHGDDDLPPEFQASRNQEDLPPAFVENLTNAREGEVIGPFETEIRGRPYFVVLHVTQVRAAGQFTFEDLRDTIRETLLQQRRVERIYGDLRERTYVEIKN